MARWTVNLGEPTTIRNDFLAWSFPEPSDQYRLPSTLTPPNTNRWLLYVEIGLTLTETVALNFTEHRAIDVTADISDAWENAGTATLTTGDVILRLGHPHDNVDPYIWRVQDLRLPLRQAYIDAVNALPAGPQRNTTLTIDDLVAIPIRIATASASITATIKDLLATNAADPAGFVAIDYDRRINHALRMFSTRIPLIGRIIVRAATSPYGIVSPILPYTFNMRDADFEDLIAFQAQSDPQATATHPHNRFLPAVLEHNGENPQVVLHETEANDLAIGNTGFIWHTRSWRLENLPPSYYAIIAEGAAGYAMRAQALAFVRQATIRPDTARLLFAQADAAIASFHAQIENARTNRHRMQIHNDNVLGLRLNDTKFAIDQQRIANIQGGIGLTAQLLDRQYIDQDQAERIVRTFDDDLLHTIGRDV